MDNINSRRLAIGTANFGQQYGAVGKTCGLDISAVSSILGHARRSGINCIDSAAVYGDSERILGEVGITDLKVITKLPPIPSKVRCVEHWVRSQVLASLKKLNVGMLDGILLHHPSDILGPYGDELIATLVDLRIENRTASLGYSLYDPSEIDALFEKQRPDIVQVPCNILDRRFLAYFPLFSRLGVRIHVRSVFLQGTLLTPPKELPVYFQPWARIFSELWRYYGDKENLVAGLLDFVLCEQEVEKVVIGVDSSLQLASILKALRRREDIHDRPELSCKDLRLIDPRTWRR